MWSAKRKFSNLNTRTTIPLLPKQLSAEVPAAIRVEHSEDMGGLKIKRQVSVLANSTSAIWRRKMYNTGKVESSSSYC